MKIVALLLLFITAFNLAIETQAHAFDFIEMSESSEVMEEIEVEEALVEPAIINTNTVSHTTITHSVSDDILLSAMAFEIVTPPPENL